MSAPPLGSARTRRAAHPGSAPPRPLRDRGQITWVTLLLLALVAGSALLAWTWLPVYFDDYAVKQVVRDYMNQAIKNSNDEQLRRNMVLKIRSLEQVDSVDEAGQPVRVPAIPLEESAVTWERDTESQPPTLHIAFEYERDVTYPLVGRTVTKTFTVDLTNDLARADWGPAR